MMATLVKKFGPEPVDVEILAEAEPIENTTSTPVPSATSPTESFKARLIRYYSKYLPDKLSQVTPSCVPAILSVAQVDSVIEKFGVEKEETVFSTLVPVLSLCFWKKEFILIS